MPAGTDFYKTLGVERNASEKDIKMAYRQLARQYHPDVNKGDATAEKRFKEINEAYAVLSDKEKRDKYDKFGAQWEHMGGAPPPGYGGGATAGGRRVQFNMEDLGDLFGGGGGGAGNLGDLFGRFSRAGAGGRGGQAFDMGDLLGGAGRAADEPPADVEATVEITLEEAFNGTERGVQLTREDVCPRCQGSGRSGRSLCIDCRGSGVISTPRRLEVKIPKGVREGSRIRVKGEGGSGPGGRPRDLYLVVHILPHRIFEVTGADLYVEVPVTVTEAVLGAEVQCPRVKGSAATMKIPAGTSGGTTFRLGGQGFPAFGNHPAGDLYMKVQIVIPKNLSDEERQLYQRLSELRHENPRTSLIGGGPS